MWSADRFEYSPPRISSRRRDWRRRRSSIAVDPPIQLAKPKKAGKYPAMLIVQYAGIYPLQPDWVMKRAKQGYIALNIMAHDLPFDQPKEFYDKASQEKFAEFQQKAPNAHLIVSSFEAMALEPNAYLLACTARTR